MKLEDFKIGTEFTVSGFSARWRCTDIGTRIIAAINVDTHQDDPSWYSGPPYAVEELVFDENDMEGCKPNSSAPQA